MREQIRSFEQTARSRCEPAAVEFFAAGSGDETSLRAAEPAWDDWSFRPRVLTDVSSTDTSCELLGRRLRAPIVLAPTAYHLLAHGEGEVESAKGARQAGALYVMATRSTRLLEEVAAAGPELWWFQVYVLKDRGLTRGLVERAVAAGASALVVTGDTPIIATRARAASPGGLSEEQYLTNLDMHLTEATRPDLAAATSQDPSITEEVIGWLAGISGLPVLVKGVLRPDDALRCLDAGAAGVVVSNHGARQLDGAVATAHVLGEVVDAVAGRAPVLVDGGVRDGRTVLKALCLGASAVMVGRPLIWALAAEGACGVRKLIEGLEAELVESMMLLGASSLGGCDRSLVCWRRDTAREEQS